MPSEVQSNLSINHKQPVSRIRTDVYTECNTKILVTHAAWNGGLPASSWKTIQPSAQRSELRREGEREKEREREGEREKERERKQEYTHHTFHSPMWSG